MATLGTFTAGQVLTAAELNAIGTWTTFNPTWTSTGTNPVLNNGTLVGQYTQINDLVVYQFFLATGSTTTYGTGSWIFNLPVTAATPYKAFARIGAGSAFDGSTSTHRALIPIHYNLSTTEILVAADAATGTPDVAATVPFAWAVDDQLSLTVIYRGA